MGIIIDKKGVAAIERKSVTLEIKSVGQLVPGQALIIEGYASTYGSETDLDRDGEFIDGPSDPFNHPNGVPLFMKNPVILADHENGTRAVVGKVVDHRIDPLGLWIRVEIPDIADDAVQLCRQKIAAGILRAFSIGGRFYREWLEKAVKIIRVDLWEVSIVAVPSRQTALFEPVVNPDLSQPAQRSAGGETSATVIERKTVSSQPKITGDTTVKVTVRRKNAQSGQIETLVIEKSAMQAGDELVESTPAATDVVVAEDEEPTEEEIQAAVEKAAQRISSKNAKLQAAVDQRLPAYLSGMNAGSKMVHGSQRQVAAPAVIQHRGEKAIDDYDSLIEVLADLKSGKISADQKVMTSSSGANAGYLIADKFLEVDEKRDGQRSIQDAVSTVPMDGGETIQLSRPSTDLAAASGTAQNTQRSSGDMAWERESRSLLTLTAPLVAISNQMLRRGGSVAETKVRKAFNRSMRKGRESWIVAGTGTSNTPKGILTETGVGLHGSVVEDAWTLIDAIRRSMTILEIDGYEADGIGLHPLIEEAIELCKDNQGRYLLPGVQRDGTTGQMRVWGMPVSKSIGFATNLGTGTDETRVLVGEWATAEYYRVGGVYVDYSEHFGFDKSLVYFRCEEEATFQCWEHPKAFYVIPTKTALDTDRP